MKVLLVRPYPPEYTIGLKNLMVCEPLELEYVAAALVGHEVEIFDMILDKDLAGKIRSFSPDIVGTSSYVTGVNVVKEICRIAKSCKPDVVTVVGGVHATIVPDDFSSPFVDVIVRGDGVSQVRKVVQALESGSTLTDIPNLAFGNNGGFTTSCREPFAVDADDYPMPRRDLVERFSGQYYYLSHKPVALVKTAFGCPFRCAFCFCWGLTDGRLYSRSADSVVEELLSIRVKDVYIVDDTFFTNPDRLQVLRDGIASKGIRKRFLTYCHARFIVDHPEIMKDWAGAGLVACIVGLESPFDSELDSYEKKASVEINTRALSIMKKIGVDVYGSFIVDPDWGKSNFAKLREYISSNGLYYVVIQPLTPMPGTKFYESCRDRLTVKREFYELWDMQHAVLGTRLPLPDFYREIRKIYVSMMLNPVRAASLGLNTVASVFSSDFLRMLFGGLRVLMQLRQAASHPRMIERRAGNGSRT